MQAHSHILAVLHVHASVSDQLVAEDCTQSSRDEHGGCISLHHPGVAGPGCLVLDILPHVHEQQCVDIELGVWPLSGYSTAVNHLRVLHLDGRTRVQLHKLITEDIPFVAGKYPCLSLLGSLNEAQLINPFFAPSLLDSNREAKERGSATKGACER